MLNIFLVFCILGLKVLSCRSFRFFEIWIPRYLIFLTGISHIEVSSVLFRVKISHFATLSFRPDAREKECIFSNGFDICSLEKGLCHPLAEIFWSLSLKNPQTINGGNLKYVLKTVQQLLEREMENWGNLGGLIWKMKIFRWYLELHSCWYFYKAF